MLPGSSWNLKSPLIPWRITGLLAGVISSPFSLAMVMSRMVSFPTVPPGPNPPSPALTFNPAPIPAPASTPRMLTCPSGVL